MTEERLKEILTDVRQGSTDIDEAAGEILLDQIRCGQTAMMYKKDADKLPSYKAALREAFEVTFRAMETAVFTDKTLLNEVYKALNKAGEVIK